MGSFEVNPVTGQLDLVGASASYINGTVADPSALPITVGNPALDSVYLAKAGSGLWLINRKPAGLYCRVANDGDLDDWTYLGAFPEVNSSANWSLYDGTTPSKELKFDLSGISASTVRTLTVPDASGTIARTETFAAPPAIGNTTPAAISGTTGTFTTLTATPSSGSALTLTGGTVTASAPLISATQTWNDGAVTFTGLLVNVTNTTSASASLLASFQVGGTSVANIRRDGRVLATSFAVVSGVHSGAGFSYHSPTEDGGHVQSLNNGGSQMWTCTVSRFRLAGDLSFGRVPGLGQGPDTILVRDDAGVLAQRNAANAQESRIYGTFTSATNYQRLTIKTKAVTLATSSGASVATTTGFIPDGAVLVGLTTRVSTAITGATGYDIGDGSDADRWGANIGFALNTSSDNTNWTAGTIECFTAAQEVTLTAVGSNFTGGAVVIVAHYLAGEAD